MGQVKGREQELQMKIVQLETEIKNNKEKLEYERGCRIDGPF